MRAGRAGATWLFATGRALQSACPLEGMGGHEIVCCFQLAIVPDSCWSQ